jgi:murein L,D-transpeptidase YafK
MAAVGVELPLADRVLVRKSERRMYLMRGNDVLRAYRIALGLNPGGHKERAGDFRTPEGSYRLTRSNARSDYFMSIQVSCPPQWLAAGWGDHDSRPAERSPSCS